MKLRTTFLLLVLSIYLPLVFVSCYLTYDHAAFLENGTNDTLTVGVMYPGILFEAKDSINDQYHLVERSDTSSWYKLYPNVTFLLNYIYDGYRAEHLPFENLYLVLGQD
ncbi:MAG: hypothetical protein AAGI38_11940 [Bacteroidota bacterium]